MKKYDLRPLIYLSLCCDLGLFAKRLINPVANIITNALHIPGGIGTSFSLMFLVISAMLVRRFGCATIMGAVQSGLALGFGMVGSMGRFPQSGTLFPASPLMLCCGSHTNATPRSRLPVWFLPMRSRPPALHLQQIALYFI